MSGPSSSNSRVDSSISGRFNPNEAKSEPLLPEGVLYFVSGGIAGAASRTIVAPLERLKIIQQCQQGTQYRGVLHGLAVMWKSEGLAGYMRGNGLNVLRIVPYSAVQFTTYEILKKAVTKDGTETLTTPMRLSCGAMAGIASVVSTYPLDLLRSRISIATAAVGHATQSELSNNATLGLVGMTRRVIEESGYRGLYKGMAATALGVAPYVGTNFALYELFRGLLLPDKEQPSVLRKLACGAMAGAVSQTITYPVDVLRRRLQVVGMRELDYHYNGAWEAIQFILKKEGLRGLYRGLWPNLLKVAPAIGTSFATYEVSKSMLAQL